MKCFKGGDFGQFKIQIGDKVITENTDFFGDGGLTDFDFGQFELKGGEQTVTVTWVGRNEGNNADGANFAVSSIYLENVSSAATSDFTTVPAIAAVIALCGAAVITVKKKKIKKSRSLK